MLNTQFILKKLGIKKENVTVAVQGMGNVGGAYAKLMAKEGYKIVAVSDVSGAIYCPQGLNIPEILEHVKTGFLSDYNAPGITRLSNEELLTLDVTVLAPAALENQINETNADQIKAKIIVEGANGPTTVAADNILNQKGVVVVPDILANAGGVIVSYFEWVQNIQSVSWNEEEVNEKLKNIMHKAFCDVWNLSQEKQESLRTAAYLIAVKRVVEAKKIRGVFP